ncbi:MAG TPA: glucose-6-phosphate isomerase family protein [Candidatus Paceibacterota bacterium]
MKKNYAERTHREMMDVLMVPESSGPEVHYYMIRGGTKKTDITIWESGTVGGEYIKTYGHYHVGKLDETYTVIQGQGIIVMQTRKTDESGRSIDDEIESFRAVRVKTGDKIFIPSGAGHLGINTGDVWFVTSDDSPVDMSERDPVSLPGHADYAPFKKLRGAAYYVVEKDGQPALVKNSLYKTVPKAEIE